MAILSEYGYGHHPSTGEVLGFHVLPLQNPALRRSAFRHLTPRMGLIGPRQAAAAHGVGASAKNPNGRGWHHGWWESRLYGPEIDEAEPITRHFRTTGVIPGRYVPMMGPENMAKLKQTDPALYNSWNKVRFIENTDEYDRLRNPASRIRMAFRDRSNALGTVPKISRSRFQV